MLPRALKGLEFRQMTAGIAVDGRLRDPVLAVPRIAQRTESVIALVVDTPLVAPDRCIHSKMPGRLTSNRSCDSDSTNTCKPITLLPKGLFYSLIIRVRPKIQRPCPVRRLAGVQKSGMDYVDIFLERPGYQSAARVDAAGSEVCCLQKDFRVAVHLHWNFHFGFDFGYESECLYFHATLDSLPKTNSQGHRIPHFRHGYFHPGESLNLQEMNSQVRSSQIGVCCYVSLQ